MFLHVGYRMYCFKNSPELCFWENRAWDGVSDSGKICGVAVRGKLSNWASKGHTLSINPSLFQTHRWCKRWNQVMIFDFKVSNPKTLCQQKSYKGRWKFKKSLCFTHLPRSHQCTDVQEIWYRGGCLPELSRVSNFSSIGGGVSNLRGVQFCHSLLA